jgi:PadR family transcriptional regulator PadR
MKIAHRHLGELEQVLLLALLRLGDAVSGGAIRRIIHERTGRVLSPGAIYTGMNRLERRGFVSSALGEPTPQRGGKRQRCYRLTRAGAAALRDMHAALAEMARDLQPKPADR